MHLYFLGLKKMGMSNLQLTCYICVLLINQSAFHFNQWDGVSRQYFFISVAWLVFGFRFLLKKKKLAGDNERASVLLQVLYSNHYNLLWGCYLYYWNMAFTEPRRLDSGKWGHIFCNPFICMDIKYAIPCIKWGGKNLFNRTKEKNEVFSFPKYPCPMCHHTIMIDSCPEGLVSGKSNKWPEENTSLGARKQWLFISYS